METTDTSAINHWNELHRKYPIQIHLNDACYYAVWGTDMSDPEQQDQLLLDHEQRILLFTTGEQIAPWIIAGSARVFDADNLTAWANSLTDFTAEPVYDLDYMGSILRSDLRQEQILQNPNLTHEMIGFMNLYSDYAYPLDDEYLVGLHRKPQLRLFFDFCYDSYFWNTPEDELTRRQASYLKKFRFGKFKADMLRMLTAFVDHCVVVP